MPAVLPAADSPDQPVRAGVHRQPPAGSGPRPKRHWPALDGLRAIAVLAVMMVHVGVLPGGYLGVDVFFVISGFLITSLLISEWDKRGGRISFRDFYARRVLRLLPALGCVIVASALLAWLLDAAGGITDRTFARATFDAIPWVVVFIGNWVRALDISSFLGMLGPTWSLSVEEQFYLLWPALFVLLMRRRFSRARLALWLGALAVAEMIYRGVLAHAGYGHDRIYFGTDTHSDGLLIGCAVAFWLASGQSSSQSRLTGGVLKIATWLGAITLVILFAIGNESGGQLQISAAVLASAVIVIGVVLGGTPAALDRVLRSHWAVWIGRRSYGLYLWQYVILVPTVALYTRYSRLLLAAGDRRLIPALALGSVVVACFTVTGLSYRFVELPALRVKRRFQGRVPETSPDPVAPIPAQSPPFPWPSPP